jgi:phenylalanyl-tRNA synthetase alpha chain
MNRLKKELIDIKQAFQKDLQEVTTQEKLESLRLHYLARKGIVAELTDSLKQLSLEEKREIGPLVQELKNFCQQAFQEKETALNQMLVAQKQAKMKYFDVTAYKPSAYRGTLHPLTHILSSVTDTFSALGFQILDGPELENEYYNFQALNIPKDHPARDMFDTFWVDIPGLLLRTHTSPVQIHAMETNKIPLAIAAPGRCYRHEATDASHDFMFMQVEGLLIDKNISLSNLLATVKIFFQTMFEKNNLAIRVRPSYFPFVEPGIEVDIECPFCKHGCSVCKHTQWIEMGGAGLIHPNVLESCSINPNEYSGFAFGFGLTRLAMLKYGINDIRLLHSNSLEFLNQF